MKIKEKKILGVMNPFLSLKFKTKNTKFDIEIMEDGESIDYSCQVLPDNWFLLTSNLKKNKSNIKIYIIINGKKQKMCFLRNHVLRRTWSKIKNTFEIIIKKFKKLIYIIYKAIRFFWREYHFVVPICLWKKYLIDFKTIMRGGYDNTYNPFDVFEYNKWLKNQTKNTMYVELNKKPLISILIPVYNIKKEFLSECLDSILNQSYENFEICLADDCSTLKETKDTLKEYEKKDSRIRVVYRKRNGHISAATNDALKIAKGEFIALVDDDDILDKDALYEMARVINEDPKVDMIYSDEDKLNLKGNYCDPHFKPDFSPDTLLSLNYICHFTVIRKKLVEDVGGFEVGLEGAQDHDLFLKVTEKTNNIKHIPKILYHWRMVEGSTSMTISNKSYATDKGKIAIENALKRRNIKGKVEKDPSTYYKISYIYKEEPKVSIIIPTRDYLDILKPCVDSIYEKTIYKNFEIIIANNDSKEEKTLNFFKEYKKKYKNFKVVDCIMDFNYSKINNIAISKCSGDYIVLLNNDTEIVTPEWLSIMVGYAMQKHIGTVGVNLLYPDYTIQHAGVIVGLGGVASHAFLAVKRDYQAPYGRLSVPYNYSASTAACLMVSKKKYEEVGGLEESLHVAYNDIDFNLKLLRKGYYNVFLPQVELIHYESKSRGLDTTSDKYKRFLIESDYMYNKWGKYIEKDPFYNPNYSKKSNFRLNKNS